MSIYAGPGPGQTLTKRTAGPGLGRAWAGRALAAALGPGPGSRAQNCLKTYRYDKRYGNNAIGHFHNCFHMISHVLSYSSHSCHFLACFLQGGLNHAEMKRPSETSPGMLARLPEMEQKHDLCNTK